MSMSLLPKRPLGMTHLRVTAGTPPGHMAARAVDAPTDTRSAASPSIANIESTDGKMAPHCREMQ